MSLGDVTHGTGAGTGKRNTSASSAAAPGRMTHSLSTPSGVDGSPSTPQHRGSGGGGGKKLTVRIQMLDDSVTIFQVLVRFIAFYCLVSLFSFT